MLFVDLEKQVMRKTSVNSSVQQVCYSANYTTILQITLRLLLKYFQAI